MNRKQRRSLSKEDKAVQREVKAKETQDKKNLEKVRIEAATIRQIKTQFVLTIRETQKPWVMAIARWIEPPKYMKAFIGVVQQIISLVVISAIGWMTTTIFDVIARKIAKFGYKSIVRRIDQNTIKHTVTYFGRSIKEEDFHPMEENPDIERVMIPDTANEFRLIVRVMHVPADDAKGIAGPALLMREDAIKEITERIDDVVMKSIPASDRVATLVERMG